MNTKFTIQKRIILDVPAKKSKEVVISEMLGSTKIHRDVMPPNYETIKKVTKSF
jgi:hypothetical protein